MSSASGRILPIDATRGFAMCFVCLSHFSGLLEPTRPELAEMMAAVAMIATPTFLLLSGAMLGLLQGNSSTPNVELTRRLFHRGLVVLLVGHVLISFASAWAHSHTVSYVTVLASRVYVTDVVGLCLIFVPRFSRSVRSTSLIAWGACLYFLTLLAVYLWHPNSLDAIVAKQLLVGLEDESSGEVMRFVSPILPYIAFYLLGIPIGRQLAAMRGVLFSERRFGITMMKLGLASIALACVLKMLWVVSGLHPVSLLGQSLHELTSFTRKIPPGPGYVLFFSGLGLTSLALFFRFHAAGKATRVLEGLAVIGQASFFVYVLQSYIFGPWLGAVPAAHGTYWPVFFAASLTAIWTAALIWKRARGNRLLDMTYRAVSSAA